MQYVVADFDVDTNKFLATPLRYRMGSKSSSATVGPLLATVFSSIFEVFLLCLAGYILAGRSILDKKTQKQINRLNVSFFTPALLFSKVAYFLSPEKLRELWIVPIFFTLVTAVSMSASFILGWLFGLKRSQRRVSFAMAAAMFMNSNSLPIALMQSLVLSVPGLQWGDDDNKHAMVGRALTYLVVYSTLGMILRWSYGVKLLSRANEPEIEPPPRVNETTPLLEFPDHEDFSSLAVVTDEPDTSVHKPSLRPPPRRPTTYFESFPNSPTDERTMLHPESNSSQPCIQTPPGADETDSESPLPIHDPRRSSSTSRRSFIHCLRCRFNRGWATFNDFMTVPLWAALVSLLVACIQPIQHALETYMQPLNSAISSAGGCSIPLTLIVLGAYFCPSINEDGGEPRGNVTLSTSRSTDTLVDGVRGSLHIKTIKHSTKNSHKLQTPGETKAVFIAVLSRMVITPVLLMPLMAVSIKFGWHRVFEDPVFVVANVLLISSPPALTLSQITQAASGDAFERLISRTIFWSYCIVTPPATIFYVVVGLILVKL